MGLAAKALPDDAIQQLGRAACWLLGLHGHCFVLQDFFAKDMGLPLTMTPNYDDFSCQ